MSNPEFFMITETELILMPMDSATAIRGMATGQMPMEIPIVPGMMKITISEPSWISVNFREVTVPLI